MFRRTNMWIEKLAVQVLRAGRVSSLHDARALLPKYRIMPRVYARLVTTKAQETVSVPGSTMETPQPKRRGRPKGSGKKAATTSSEGEKKPKRESKKGADEKQLRPSRTKRASAATLASFTDAPLYTYSEPLDPSNDTPFCYPHMPHPSRWKSAFLFTKEQHARHRYFVANRNTVEDIVQRIALGERELKGLKTTVVEAYPGPGTFTRAFMNHPNVERVIAMEDVPMFLDQLEHLKQDPSMTGKHDKLHIIPESGYAWDTYERLENEGCLNHLEGRVTKIGANSPPMDWDATSPILFFAQLPNTVHGEQLYAQLVHAISSRSWLFKYGRVQMVFVCGETVALRSLASPQDMRTRAKLGATVQSLSTPKTIMEADELEPYAEHMYPSTPSVGPRVPVTSVFIPNSNISTGLQKRKLTVLAVDPLKEPLIAGRDMDAFEFLTRNMFVLKTKTVAEGLKHVAPGAHNVLNLLSADHPRMKERKADVVLPDTPIVELTNRQWAALAEAFEKWPFRPDVYVDEGRVRRGMSDYVF